MSGCNKLYIVECLALSIQGRKLTLSSAYSYFKRLALGETTRYIYIICSCNLYTHDMCICTLLLVKGLKEAKFVAMVTLYHDSIDSQ